MTVKTSCLAEKGKITIWSRAINNAENRRGIKLALALIDLKRLEFIGLVVVIEVKTRIATSL